MTMMSQSEEDHTKSDGGGEAALAEDTSLEKNVRFHSVVGVQRIPSCTQFSSNIIDRCWYSREELIRISPRCLNHNEKKRWNKACCSDGECLRGLEGRLTSRKGRYLSKKTPQQALYTVMDEQDLQRRAGQNDPETLALVYGNVSRPSQEEALALALMDEMFVRNHVHDKVTASSCEHAADALRSASVLTSNSPDYDHIKLCTCFEAKPAEASLTSSPKLLKRRTWKSEPRNLLSLSSNGLTLSPKVQSKNKIKSPTLLSKKFLVFNARWPTTSNNNASKKERNTTCATSA